MSKLDGIKAGDRVRVTFEGVVECTSINGWCDINLGHEGKTVVLSPVESSEPTFQITRIEPPLKVGDKVTWGRGVDDWELVAIRGARGIIWNGLRAQSLLIEDLRRA